MSVIGNLIDEYMYLPDDSIMREHLVSTMQTRCPGNYNVIFEESPRLKIIVQFRDAEEATMFRIKGWM